MLSQSLTRSVEEFNQVGTCHLSHGFAQDIGTLLTETVDVISASALLHEVYSYGGGYSGLHAMMRTLPTVLNPNGFFVYRASRRQNTTRLSRSGSAQCSSSRRVVGVTRG